MNIEQISFTIQEREPKRITFHCFRLTHSKDRIWHLEQDLPLGLKTVGYAEGWTMASIMYEAYRMAETLIKATR